MKLGKTVVFLLLMIAIAACSDKKKKGDDDDDGFQSKGLTMTKPQSLQLSTNPIDLCVKSSLEIAGTSWVSIRDNCSNCPALPNQMNPQQFGETWPLVAGCYSGLDHQ